MTAAADDSHRERAPSEGGGMASAALLMIFAILGSRVVGLIRQMLFAHYFGTAGEFTAFRQAFRIPDLVYFLIAGGALRSGFIPVFAEYYERGDRERAWKTFNALFGVLFVFGGLVVAAGMMASPWLVSLVAGGKGLTHQQQALCAQMMRVMFPAQLFFVLGGLLMGTANALRHFTWPAIGPIVYTLIIIAATLALAPGAGPRAIPYLAYAVVAGAFLGNFLMQLPPLARLGVPLRPRLDWRDEGVRKVAILVLPIIFGLSVSQLNLIITTRLATDISEGAASVLDYSNLLMNLPVGAFGNAIAIAIFPTLAAQAALAKSEQFRHSFSFGIRNVLFVSLPAAALLGVLAEPICRLLFERGSFTEADTMDVSSTLVWYCLAIVPLAAQQILARCFYAFQDTKTPATVGVASVVICGLAGHALVKPMGVNGLALALSLASLANTGLLFWILHERMGRVDGKRILVSTIKISAASLLVGAIAREAYHGLHSVLYTDTLPIRLALVFGPLLLASGLYVLSAVIFEIEEWSTAWELLTRRFRR